MEAMKIIPSEADLYGGKSIHIGSFRREDASITTVISFLLEICNQTSQQVFLESKQIW